MPKILLTLFIIIGLFFGFLIIKNINLKKATSGEAFVSLNKFGENYVSEFKKVSDSVAILPEGPSDQDPVISAKDLGELSPFYGKVKIERSSWGAAASNPKEEYVTIIAQKDNERPINITGWSLQSMISGTRVYIQDAVEDMEMHKINPTYEIELSPGEYAIINTHMSPLGVSFKTNMCTGYFAHFQKFQPPLDKNCPSPTSIMPPTVLNIKKYGAECMDLVSELRPCQYLTEEILAEVSVKANRECIDFLKMALTYTYCRSENKNKEEYAKNSVWRIFLNEQNALWNNRYEVIRLLDRESRTVDVYSY